MYPGKGLQLTENGPDPPVENHCSHLHNIVAYNLTKFNALTTQICYKSGGIYKPIYLFVYLVWTVHVNEHTWD